jgi:hypothetical protein
MLLWSIASQLIFGVHQIVLECEKTLNFGSNGLDLIINVLYESVMRDCSLCGREHGLFLGEENVLLVPSEFAL